MDSHTIETTDAILFNSVVNVLNDPGALPSQLEDSPKPFAAIQWTKPVIKYITASKLNRLFGRLKRSQISKDAPRLVIDHFHRALEAEAEEIPLRPTDRRDAVNRSSLNTLASPDTWVSVCVALEIHRIPDPLTLARVSLVELEAIAATSPFGEMIAPLWQAVRIEMASNLGVAQPTMAFRNTPMTIPDALRAPNVEESIIGKEYDLSKQSIGLPTSCQSLGPTERIAALKAATPDSQQLLRFLSAGSHANVLQQVRLTLPSVASGVSCYLAFCSLLSIDPFPPTSAIARQWSTMFPHGRHSAFTLDTWLRRVNS